MFKLINIFCLTPAPSQIFIIKKTPPKKPSPKGRKKKSSGSPRKAKAPVGDTKGGSGTGYKSKEFIESSGSGDDSGDSGKPKKKKMKTEPKVKTEDKSDDSDDDDEYEAGSASDTGSEAEKKPKGRRTSKRGKPGGEIKEEAEEFAGVSGHFTLHGVYLGCWKKGERGGGALSGVP